LQGEDCLLFINSYQKSYLSDVGIGFFPITFDVKLVSQNSSFSKLKFIDVL